MKLPRNHRSGQILSPAVLTLGVALLGSQTAIAQPIAEPAVQSAPQSACPSATTQVPQTLITDAERNAAPVEINARMGNTDATQAMLTGDVTLSRADQFMSAQAMEFDQATGRGRAKGGVTYRDQLAEFSAETIDFDLPADQSQLNDLSYRLRNSGGRGDADSATVSRDQIALESVSFTTCPAGDNGWSMQAREMQLDQTTGRGTARGARLDFKGLPFLYLPWTSFPIDERRQSGLLYPTLGSSNDNGLDLSIPYYWNIAANQDATLAPRFISDRGVMLEAEYRYLSQRFGGGQLDVQYLPEDDITGEERAYTRLRHRGPLTTHWFADVDINDVSDVNFLEDFGDSLLGASPIYLRSRVGLNRRGSWWRAGILLDDYEIVDADVTADLEPYARLPRLTFAGTREINYNLQLETEFEAAAFRRDEGLEGNRIDWYSAISRPLYRPGYYITPTLGLRHTNYDLDRANANSPSRTLPIASVEGGLQFERTLGEGRWQTLEPRFHLLYVPFEDQTELPEFDSRELTFSYGQLFRTNRFTGADRQADAKQLSLGLTTRIFDQQGSSPFEASLGTIVYFDEQRVQLGTVPAVDTSTSPLIGELRYRPSQRWQLSSTLQWDPDDDQIDQAVLGIRHRGERGQLVNFGYRQRRDRLEQLDASVMWPINERWNVLGRWNYSLRDDTTLEALAGFEYDSCCWSLRLFGRQYLRNQEGDKRTGVLLEIELKGLGSLGRASQELLERAVLGYRRRGVGN